MSSGVNGVPYHIRKYSTSTFSVMCHYKLMNIIHSLGISLGKLHNESWENERIVQTPGVHVRNLSSVMTEINSADF